MEVRDTEDEQGQAGKLTLIERMRKFDDRDRQLHPHRYVNAVDGLGPNWLFVENAAAMLGATVDFVRRISREELPAAIVGKRVIYARTDIDAYITQRIQRASRHYVPDKKLRVVSGEAGSIESAARGATFDPVAKVLAVGGGK